MHDKKIAIIHCGFHKTASSSIQHTLAKNRELLMDNGWLYPKFYVEGKSFYNQSMPLYGYYCKHPENFKHYWYHNQLKHEVVNRQINSSLSDFVWNHPKIIFSDEFISVLDVLELYELKNNFQANGYEVRVISFVRDPVDLVKSTSQQRSKVEPVNEILNVARPKEQHEKIKKLRTVFRNSAEFYCFEKACNHNAGPAGFFFDLIGVSLDPQQTVRVNEGMSLQAVRLLSYINAQAPLF